MKIFYAVLFCLFTSQAFASDVNVFVGYDNDGKERYVTWNDTDKLIANMKFDKGAKRISKHAAKCMNDEFWNRAEMLEVSEKHDIRSHKFKFHWVLDSRILYVDVDTDEMVMSCRDG